jgi:shikimate dehydrogenase
MTQYIGLIGYPLKHSISPAFQQAALDDYKLDIQYQVWETALEDLPDKIRQLRLPHNLGANVTIPYKENVLQLLDEVDGQASAIGAVNTIINMDGRLIGYNTDAYGFIQALRRDANFEAKNKHVALLGAGGAARAVSFALLWENIDSLVVVNRTLARAEALSKSLLQYVKDTKVHVDITTLPWRSSKYQEIIRSCQLIVNCTTLGTRFSPHENQSPLDANLIAPHALVYDLVYNPTETPLLKLAQEAGASVIGGLSMLVYQGAAAFELWVEKQAPLDIMFYTAGKSLERAGK